MRGAAEYASGALEPWTCDILVAFAHALEPPRMLELGTFEGMTTKRLAETAQDFGGHVTSIELDYERHQKAKRLLASHENVTLFQADTVGWMRFWQGENFHFAFVDDDHTADHVAKELEVLKQMMEPGGYIFVHDVDGPFGLDKVVEGAGGYCLKLPKLHAGGGLGVIQC